MPYKILIAFGFFIIFAVPLYLVTPTKYRYISLLICSLLFIEYISGWGVIFILITAGITYLAALVMDKLSKQYNIKALPKEERKTKKAELRRKKKIITSIYICINIGILLLLKYFNFFSYTFVRLANMLGGEMLPLSIKIAAPLGISYYTLQSITYVIDVYRGKYNAEKNFLKVALFVSFFPQLHEGPFGRYDLLAPQLTSGKPIIADNAFNGFLKIECGLFKIFMIANRAAMISDEIFLNHDQYGGFVILFGGISFIIQLYAEFSGYINIAQGVSKIFGIDLAKNFDMPFISQSVAEFWRRWHISLGGFFRDYVFFPVSTSKFLRKITKNLSFTTANFLNVGISLFVVWFLTGLWHGANEKYICYGLYYFILIFASQLIVPFTDKLLAKLKINKENKFLTIFRIIRTNILVFVGMLMFRAENLSVFGNMFISIFSKGKPFPLTDIIDIEDFVVLLVSLLLIVILSVMKIKNIDLEEKYNHIKYPCRYWILMLIFFTAMIFGAFGLDYLPPDPIYGGF